MTVIKLRRGTAAEWTATNPILADGEPGYERDTGKVKVGDGSRSWSALPYTITEIQVQDLVNTHANRKDNPHEVTKAQVGLGNVDNTSDTNKPVSAAVQSALDGKEPAGLVAAHEAKADPHPVYLTQTEGDGRYSQINPIPIPDGTDLNDLTTSGVYFRANSSGSNVSLNYPLDTWAGTIEVFVFGATAMQRATSYFSSPIYGSGTRANVWYRTRSAGVWDPWTRIQTSLEGVGSPEGVFSASLGFTYKDLAGTNGAWKWVKKSTSGNTGWGVKFGDTGWRINLDGLFENGAFSGGGVYTRLRRQNDLVQLNISLSTPTEWVAGTSGFQLPLGFRGPTTYLPMGYMSTNPRVVMASTGVINIWGASSNSRWSWSWFTEDPWPTTLPGTPG